MALNKVGTVPGILRCPEDGKRLEERWIRLAGDASPSAEWRMVCPECDSIYEIVEQAGQQLRETRS